jgi:hypothetical protein
MASVFGDVYRSVYGQVFGYSPNNTYLSSGSGNYQTVENDVYLVRKISLGNTAFNSTWYDLEIVVLAVQVFELEEGNYQTTDNVLDIVLNEQPVIIVERGNYENDWNDLLIKPDETFVLPGASYPLEGKDLALINFSTGSFEMPCETLKISACKKTFDTSD